MMDRKANLGLVGLVSVIMILASTMGVFYVTSELLNVANTGMQSSICSANIMSANALKGVDVPGGKNIWTNVLSKTAEGGAKELGNSLLKHPLCITQVEHIDLRKEKDVDKATIYAGKQIGEMIESCWKTFGEGVVPNTFGQDKKDGNYYFSCYKFKLLLNENIPSIPVVNKSSGVKHDLLSLDKGILLLYDIRGKGINDGTPMTEDYFMNRLKQETTGEVPPSYAGFVNYGGQGYLEFITDIESKLDYELEVKKLMDGFGKNAVAGSIAGAVIGAGIVAGIVAFNVIGGPAAWAVTGAIASASTIATAATAGAVAGAVAGTSVAAKYTVTDNLINQFNTKILASNHTLDNLDSDIYYEIRYYSPYYADKGTAFSTNSIKVMPIGSSSSKVTEKEGVGTQSGGLI